MELRSYEIENIEPLDNLSGLDCIAVNVLLRIGSAIADNNHLLRLRLILPRDEAATLASLSETARRETAAVFSAAADHLGNTDLATLVATSRAFHHL